MTVRVLAGVRITSSGPTISKRRCLVPPPESRRRTGPGTRRSAASNAPWAPTCCRAPSGAIRVSGVVLHASPDDLQRQILHGSGSFSALKRPAVCLASRYLRGLPADNRQPIDCTTHLSLRPLAMIRGANDRVVPDAVTTAPCAGARPPKDRWRRLSAGHGGYLDAAPRDYPGRPLGFFKRTSRAAPGQRTTESAHSGPCR